MGLWKWLKGHIVEDEDYVSHKELRKIKLIPSQRLDVVDAMERTIGRPEYVPGHKVLRPSGK